MAIDFDTLSRIIRETDAAYAAGNDAQKQAAVAQRESVVNQWASQGYQNVASAPAPAPPSSSGGGYSPPPAPSPVPKSPWVTTSSYVPPSGVKQAEPDIILDPETNTSGDYIAERFFEEIGGTELISISRHDLIDGINVTYSAIANLSQIRRRFNPNNIIAMDIYSDNEFSKSAIDLISRGMNEPYFDDNGDLIVEVDIIRPEENIEAQISQQGTITRIEI